MSLVIHTGTDGTLTLTGLTQADTAVNTATVTASLDSISGTSAWSSVSFTASGSGGNYTYSYGASDVPAAGTYKLTVTAVYTGSTLTFEEDVVVRAYQL